MTYTTLPDGAAVQPCSQAPASPTSYWIELELLGEDGKGIACEQYRVVLPGGESVTGYLDADGFARLQSLQQPGDCTISFPALDRRAWERIAILPAKASEENAT